ncbi:sensor histidine kinase [Acinetobacter tianfuensis]|uniref:histidine kinase n=1 Tax=Acinetobacter tianfuensis TaxID=2419603 RepID=A0A3A8EM98_9GAMM|nr:ATP-binding protein [Acinetobacter tianfuensis]RKG34616.1 GHKL domain-containing protein [Acinetobacter tianfuensis]
MSVLQAAAGNSLKRKLILYISFFSLVVACGLMMSAYRIALEETNEILDAQMKNLAERVAHHGVQPVQSQYTPARHYHEEDLFVDVWAYDAAAAKRSDGLLVPTVPKAGFYTHKTLDGIWYTYILPYKDYQIQISQQQSVRQNLALELAGSMLIPYLLLMPFVIWGLSWMISRILQPLDDFRDELAQRSSRDLKPISVQEYPLEIIPTIEEMNQLLERIELSQQEQRQFIADAAHELRTPITALGLQMQVLLQEYPEHEALQRLNLGLVRTQHLVTQLLNLAKQDALLEDIQHLKDFNIAATAVSCVEQLIHLAMQKNLDLGMERQEELMVQSRESAVHSIIYNLIDNAIKYTPENGVINVSVFEQEQKAVILVEDSGPGIDPQLHEQILKRFYRVYHHQEAGSGLGLSIVDKAVQRINGQLSFAASESLGGLKVTVIIPLKPSA